MLPDIPSTNTYGGVMRDYSSAVDPTTDEAAIYRNRYVADVAAMARTAPKAIASFQGQAGVAPIDPPSGLIHDAMWGSLPGYKPTAAYVSTGVVDLTWPTIVNDALTPEDVTQGGGETHVVNFRRAIGYVEQSDGTFRAASAKVTGPNTVRVYLYSGITLNDLSAQVFTVVVW